MSTSPKGGLATASTLTAPFRCEYALPRVQAMTSGVSGVSPEERIALDAVRNGNSNAYATLVDLHMRRALSISWGIVRNEHDAEDIVQEAFVKAYEKIGSMRSGDAFAPWLFRIVTNLSLDHLRRQKRRPSEELRDDFASSSRTDAPPLEALAARIDTAILTLPEMQQLVARLHLIEEMSHSEVARITGLSEGTIRSHLSHARKKLQNLLHDVWEDQ
jgi:RNA polymerase sigma-70 factor, ECF subfamily